MNTSELAIWAEKAASWAHDLGAAPYPAGFDKAAPIATLRAQAEGVRVATAGRVVQLREMGRIAFGDLADASGTPSLRDVVVFPVLRPAAPDAHEHPPPGAG